MSRSDPAVALNGVQTGHICDSCNKRIRSGDVAGLYATWNNQLGWEPRRTYCCDCCPDDIQPATRGTDEVILTGIFFSHRLVSIETRERDNS